MYENQYQRKFEPGVEFLILIGIFLAGLLIGSISAFPIWIIMTGKSLFTMQKDMLDPANVNALKVIQVVSTIIIFFIPAVITARITSVKPYEHLGFHKRVKFNWALCGILIMISVLPFVGYLAEINKSIWIPADVKKFFDGMEIQYGDQVKLMATFKTPVDYLIALFIIALLPALVEEVFFRGGIQNLLLRWKNNSHVYIIIAGVLTACAYHIWFRATLNIWLFYLVLILLIVILSISKKVTNAVNPFTNHPFVAILATSVIFSMIHASWYGFIPRLGLGMILGYIFYYTGNLWYSIIAHFFNNALMITILYWQYTKEKKIDMEVGETAPWWAGVISAAVVIGLFIVLKKLTETKVVADSIAEEPVSRPPDYLS